MIRISCVLTLALGLTSCGGDTGSSLKVKNGQISGSFENMPAKSVAGELINVIFGFSLVTAGAPPRLQLESFADYKVTNALTDRPGEQFTFEFEKLKTPADLKKLLEKELKARVTLDEQAKTFAVEATFAPTSGNRTNTAVQGELRAGRGK